MDVERVKAKLRAGGSSRIAIVLFQKQIGFDANVSGTTASHSYTNRDQLAQKSIFSIDVDWSFL